MRKYKILAILLVVVLIFIGIFIWMKKAKQAEEEPEMSAEENESLTLSSKDSQLYQSILKYLRAKGFNDSYAKYALAQSRHETGNYKSKLANEYNNYFGMMQPQRRETTSLGATPSGFASYDGFDSSAADYVLYLEALDYPVDGYPTLKEYIADARKKGYYTDSFVNYYADTQKLFNQLKINS